MTGKAKSGGADAAPKDDGKAEDAGAPAPVAAVPTLDEVVSALCEDQRFGDLLASIVVTVVAGDKGFVANVLAADGFADGVAQIVTARVQSDDFPATIMPAINDYLNANLPELVAAAMPETPEKAAARQAKAAARAQDERERADRKVAREREEAAEAERAAREERKAGARERRASIYSGKGDAEPVDLAQVKRGTLALDDGDHLSIDFARDIKAGQLVAVDGNTLLLQSRPIVLGEGMPEGFAVDAVLLVLEMEEGHRVLRCPMPAPVLVGGGATAQLGENSLSFRPI